MPPEPATSPDWRPLRQALALVYSATPAALPPAAALAATQPGEWNAATAYRVHRLLTTELRDHAERAGIDPDMLPVPPPPVAVAAAGNQVSVVAAPGVTFPPSILAVAKNDPSGRVLPGSATLSVTDTLVDALRALAKTTPVTFADDALALLRSPVPAANLGVDLTDAGRVRVRAAAEKPLVSALTRIPGLRWNAKENAWLAPASQVPAVVKTAQEFALPVSPEALQAAGAATEAFDYDGSLQGLQGIPCTDLTRVDAKAGERFADMGLHTIYDLLMWTPRRYLDRSTAQTISQTQVGRDAVILGAVSRIQADPHRRLVRFEVSDSTGTISVTFFNALWQAKRFRVGDEVVLLGSVEEWSAGSRRTMQMTNPIMDLVGEETLPVIPVYGQSGKSRVTTWDITQAAREALARLGDLADPLPATVVAAEGLISRAEALRLIHFPAALDQVAPARERLAFDELFRMQAALQLAKHGHAIRPGFAHHTSTPAIDEFLERLPFTLTPAQQRAWEDISTDLRSPTPMHRLLQGDVGSGKTMLAALTLLAAVTSGRQGALMAPTEILATQLHTELCSRLRGVTMGDRAIKVELLTNKVRGKRRDALLAALATGDVDIIVGTHALLVDDVEFASLSAVVVDEQHRFGVEQRATLRDKTSDGITPDMLVMTATPIPRTAAMTVFGDLDLTVIDELPPGRTPIVTSWTDAEPALDGLATPPWDTVRSEVAAGRQAYVVCPLVTESEKLQAANATETFGHLSDGALAGLRVGLVHGQQRAEERSATMAAFAAGELDVLVATTVIEVGVNVPNATVMVVLDAGRFGIAQLHQLRGRVGRGEHASRCFLVGRVVSPDGRARMQALCDSTDGFYLSEVDLDLRGHGSILGSEQSGMSDLRVASLDTDMDILERARGHAAALMADDPTLARRPLLRAEIVAALGSDAMSWLARS